MDAIHHIITELKAGQRSAQQQLYKMYGPSMLSLARRYIRNINEAEDVFIEAFYKILTKIDSYSGAGSFEGWMKRIVVNEALMHLRKRELLIVELDNYAHEGAYKMNVESDMDYKELLKLLDLLPPGYRTVFNMYVIEGYKHREIAEILDISINTSKSQLILARKKLAKIIKKKQRYNIA